MLNITLDSCIRFRVDPAKHADLIQAIKPDVNVPNPAYAEALRYNRSTWNIPEFIKCFEYDRHTREVRLPRGYFSRLVYHLESIGLRWDVQDRRVSLPRTAPADHINLPLRGYQIPAADILVRSEGGVLQAPAGSGKTNIGLEVLARIGQPALWVTHTNDLANQTIERAMDLFDLRRDEIGIIGLGKERIGEWLTIGSVRTLARRDLSQWAHTFGTVILDEAHHCPASVFKSVMHAFPARYRYGLTATPKRKDGLEALTDLYIGPIVHRIPRTEVEAAGGVVKASLQVIDTGWQSEVWAEHEKAVEEWKKLETELILQGRSQDVPPQPMIDYAALTDEMILNDKRNALLTRVLARVCPGHASLGLTSRITHGAVLQRLLEGLVPNLRTALLHHEVGMTERHEILDAMRRGELDLIFAVDIPKEGLDIPRLDRLFYLTGGRDDIMVEQSIGRIQRPHAEKDDALVVDFVDFDVPILRAQHYHRRKVYRALGMIGPGERVEAITA